MSGFAKSCKKAVLSQGGPRDEAVNFDAYRSRYLNVTDGQTDGRTDGRTNGQRHTMA